MLDDLYTSHVNIVHKFSNLFSSSLVALSLVEGFPCFALPGFNVIVKYSDDYQRLDSFTTTNQIFEETA